jgi:hypothetical protein
MYVSSMDGLQEEGKEGVRILQVSWNGESAESIPQEGADEL